MDKESVARLQVEMLQSHTARKKHAMRKMAVPKDLTVNMSYHAGKSIKTEWLPSIMGGQNEGWMPIALVRVL